MKFLEIMQDCCLRTSDNIPRTGFSDEDSSKEWRGYIFQAVKSVLRVHNWSKLKKKQTIIADGYEYALPDDFMQMESMIYNRSSNSFITSVSNDELLSLNNEGDFYTIMGGKIILSKSLNGDELEYIYISKNSVKSFETGREIEQFSNDDDEYLLDSELITLKAIALRSVNLGFPDASMRISDFNEYLQYTMAQDGAPVRFNKYEQTISLKTTSNDWQVA